MNISSLSSTYSLPSGKALKPHTKVLQLKGRPIRTIRFTTEARCTETYGFQPGSVLYKQSKGPLIVLGMEERTHRLWVNSTLNSKQTAYPLADVHRLQDLTLKGYTIIQKKDNQEVVTINDKNEFANQIYELFKMQIDCDVYFEVEGSQVGGFSFLLKESSTDFKTLLEENGKKEQPNIISIENCRLSDFQMLMEYLHFGYININQENVQLITQLADRFGITSLRLDCQKFLENQSHTAEKPYRNSKYLDANHTLKKYGVEPGAVLYRSSTGPLVVLGEQERKRCPNLLWVKEPLHTNSLAYPLKNIHNAQDLKNKGYFALPKKRKHGIAELENKEELVNRVQKVFKTEINCDVHFEVEEKCIEAHRFFLKLGSPYFRTLLGKDFKDSRSTNAISIPDCTEEDFKMIVDYLYSGSITIDQENILWISQVAEHFQITTLSLHCRDLLPTFLQPEIILTYIQAIAEKPHSLEFLILNTFYQQLERIIEVNLTTLGELTQEHMFFLIQNCPEDLRNNLFDLFVIWFVLTPPIQSREEIEKLFSLFQRDESSLLVYAKALSRAMELDPPTIGKLTQEKMLFLVQSCHENHTKDVFKLFAIWLAHTSFIQPVQQTDRLFGLFPQDTSSLLAYARTLSAYETAVPNSRTQFENYQQDSESLALKAVYAFGSLIKQRLESASDLFEQILKVDSHLTFALMGYAETLRHLNRSDEALIKFKEVLSLEPQNKFALVRYAEILRQSGQVREAHAKFKEALPFEPEDNFAWLGFAQTADLTSLNWSTPAKKTESDHYIAQVKDGFKKALSLDPQDVSALIGYANLYFCMALKLPGFTVLQQDNFYKAKDQLKHVLSIHPNHILALEGLKKLYQYSLDFPHLKLNWWPEEKKLIT